MAACVDRRRSLDHQKKQMMPCHSFTYMSSVVLLFTVILDLHRGSSHQGIHVINIIIPAIVLIFIKIWVVNLEYYCHTFKYILIL